MFTSRTSPQPATLVLLSALFLLTGCNLIGYAASGIAGDPKSEAKFVPAKKPLVVIAENFASPAEASLDSEPLARYIGEELAAHEVAPIIDHDRVLALQTDKAREFRSMTIAAVGRAVGADQILYVNIIDVNANFADSSDLIKGHGEVRVRLVDANTGATIWPTDALQGFTVIADTRIVRSNERNESIVRSDVHRALAVRVARLFYAAKSE
jgi:PBP1b-binding outer membrane lipoprotein LpoB